MCFVMCMYSQVDAAQVYDVHVDDVPVNDVQVDDAPVNDVQVDCTMSCKWCTVRCTGIRQLSLVVG